MPRVDEPWDERKARANLRKHGVSSEEAVTVDDDEQAWSEPDLEHSDLEPRFRVTGLSDLGRIITVACVYRRGKMRPISAWRATLRELNAYLYRHG